MFGGITAKTAPTFVVCAGICWGIIGLFARHLSALGYSPVQITFGRSLVTAVIMFLFMACCHRKDLHVAVKDVWMFLGTGLCSIVFFNVCYFTAIELTTLSAAAILLYTAPSIVMVLSVILFKESFTPVKAVCLAAAFIGCVLVSGFGMENMNVLGVLAGLGAGLGYALYSIFGHYALAKYTPYTVTTWTFIIASLGLMGISDVSAMAAVMAEHPAALCWMAGLGVFSTTVPFILYTLALREMDAGKASILASVEPLTSTVVGITVFGEAVTVFGAAGIVCILGAVVLLNKKS